MYELANTSLPNGLIAGTHGFATVAMTKGFPDTLRARVETYCAYTHRSGAHDVSYSKENPVNWFHVVLPQGEHIMGRVAPADFDYTGRTNRLARLLVFPKGEVPGIGGASVLRKEFSRFVAPWSGEARWLDVDKLTPGRLRLDMPSAKCDAPTWRAMFGDGEGLKLAKGFARQLSKNMSSGGRTIYFKTSTVWDLDGTKLLALFADLIDMLPVPDRQKVSFSTYPVALPQGTVCHLRGVFDRDRIFDAAASTQAWIDCEKGTVHNASLLPPEDVKPVSVAKKVAPVFVPTAATNRPMEMSRSAPSLMPPRKDGTKALFIGIVITVATMVLVAVGAGVYLWNETQRKMRESGALQAQERLAKEQKDDEVRKTIESERKRKDAEQQRKLQEEKREDDEKTRREEAERKKAEVAKRELEQANKKMEMEQKAKENARREQAEEEQRKNLEHKRVAFIDAKEVKILGSGIQAKYSDARDQQQMTNGTLRVFWYGKDGSLTNAPAGFRSGKNKSVKSLEFHPKPNELVKETSGMFLIWFDIRKKVAYWDWSSLDKKELTAWFAETNEIDLVEVCFGKTLEVRDTWKKIVGGAFSIAIEIEDGKGKYQMPFECNLDPFSPHKCLSVNDVINFVSGKEKGKKDLDLKGLEGRIIELKAQRERVQAANGKYNELRKKLDSINESLKQLKKTAKKQTLNGDTEKSKKKESHLVKQQIGEIWDGIKGDHSCLGIVLRFDNNIITGWEDIVTKIDEVINEKEKELKDKKQAVGDNDSKIREEVKSYKFRIIKVGGNAK